MNPRFRPDAHRQRVVGAARLPRQVDEDWILAAVHRNDLGAAAWRRIRGTFDVLDPVDGHARLVPLIYETVARNAPDDPLLPELGRGRLLRLAQRRALLDRVSPVIGALVDDGTDVMVLKGAALADVYESPAHRPMVDVDLLVRPHRLPHVAEVLGRHGLRAEVDVLQPVKVACLHSISFLTLDGAPGNVDLHWMASPQLAPPGVARAQWRRPWYLELADDEFWGRARSIVVEGTEVVAPSMTDLFLLSVLHGARFGLADDTRWAVDAATILTRRGDEIDWDMFVEQASRRRVGAVTANALDYLSQRILLADLAATLPRDVVSRLRSRPPRRRERLIDRLSAQESAMSPGALRLIVDVVIRHLVMTAGERGVATVRSFPWFVALWLGVDRPRRIPMFLRRGSWRDRLQ